MVGFVVRRTRLFGGGGIVSPRPTTPAPARPACGPAACMCADCGAKRAAMGRVLAEQAALSAAQLAERTRILSMLERFASGYEDAGDTAEAEVTRSLARAIEQGQHWTQDGNAFVAVEVAS